MTPDTITPDGVECYRLDNPAEVEGLARALEEAAARVRSYPPAVVTWDVGDDVEVGPVDWTGHGQVLERRPVHRVFELRWPG